MHSERHADGVLVWAPAKVNLYLEVLARRADGFHELETLLVAVSLYDTLEFKEEKTGQVRLRCNHPELSQGPTNLVWRAAMLLRERTGCSHGADIQLTKRIPLAAGLAGGSTDAAATLAGLNRLWRLGLGRTQLAALAGELGSDVAFFFSTPAAWCTGRGEQVTATPLGKPLWFVLVFPPFGLATADVYRGVTVPEQPIQADEMRAAVAAGDAQAIGAAMHNRLQSVAESLCPELAAYRTWLASLRPAGQLLSGSGSTYFALCGSYPEALRIARELSRGMEELRFPSSGRGRIGTIVRSCS